MNQLNKQRLENWKLNDEFSVIEASWLIAGVAPDLSNQGVENHKLPYDHTGEIDLPYSPEDDIKLEFMPKYNAAFSALTKVVLSHRLPAEITSTKGDGFLEHKTETKYSVSESKDINFHYNSVVWDRSTILLEDLKTWLISRNFKPAFFFPTEEQRVDDFLDPKNLHYAQKLAAAVAAWSAVTASPALTKGKTPKQALMLWLRNHADQFGLLNNDGSPIDQAIEEIAKVANWSSQGGAPKTP